MATGAGQGTGSVDYVIGKGNPKVADHDVVVAAILDEATLIVNIGLEDEELGYLQIAVEIDDLTGAGVYPDAAIHVATQEQGYGWRSTPASSTRFHLVEQELDTGNNEGSFHATLDADNLIWIDGSREPLDVKFSRLEFRVDFSFLFTGEPKNQRLITAEDPGRILDPEDRGVKTIPSTPYPAAPTSKVQGVVSYELGGQSGAREPCSCGAGWYFQLGGREVEAQFHLDLPFGPFVEGRGLPPDRTRRSYGLQLADLLDTSGEKRPYTGTGIYRTGAVHFQEFVFAWVKQKHRPEEAIVEAGFSASWKTGGAGDLAPGFRLYVADLGPQETYYGTERPVGSPLFGALQTQNLFGTNRSPGTSSDDDFSLTVAARFFAFPVQG